MTIFVRGWHGPISEALRIGLLRDDEIAVLNAPTLLELARREPQREAGALLRSLEDRALERAQRRARARRGMTPGASNP